MLEKFTAILGLRFRQKTAAPDEKLAVDAEAQQSLEQLSPKEVRLAFTVAQNLLLDLMVRKVPAFDMEALSTHDPETYWGLVEYGVRIERFERLNRPARADSFRAFVREYALALDNAASLMQKQTLGGE
jgi:hypothetical protein